MLEGFERNSSDQTSGPFLYGKGPSWIHQYTSVQPNRLRRRTYDDQGTDVIREAVGTVYRTARRGEARFTRNHSRRVNCRERKHAGMQLLCRAACGVAVVLELVSALQRIHAPFKRRIAFERVSGEAALRMIVVVAAAAGFHRLSAPILALVDSVGAEEAIGAKRAA